MYENSFHRHISRTLACLFQNDSRTYFKHNVPNDFQINFKHNVLQRYVRPLSVPRDEVKHILLSFITSLRRHFFFFFDPTYYMNNKMDRDGCWKREWTSLPRLMWTHRLLHHKSFIVLPAAWPAFCYWDETFYAQFHLHGSPVVSSKDDYRPFQKIFIFAMLLNLMVWYLIRSFVRNYSGISIRAYEFLGNRRNRVFRAELSCREDEIRSG